MEQERKSSTHILTSYRLDNDSPFHGKHHIAPRPVSYATSTGVGGGILSAVVNRPERDDPRPKSATRRTIGVTCLITRGDG
jgi:hypothetical protein